MEGLVERVLGFEVDDAPGVPLGFRDRLARENGWSPGYAARVYDEYRRFLVLAATGTDPVTPSDEVDQAWHLHLTYTRSYWDRLCGEVLGRPLHHDATTGTVADGSRHRRQYAATLDRYRQAFGTEPPADIWPPVAERFREPARWRRVDTRAHLVVRRAPLVAGGAGALLVATGTAAASGSAVGPLVALVVLLACVGGVILFGLWLVARSNRRRRSGRGWDHGAGGVWFFGGDGGSDHGSGCGPGDSGGSGGCGGGGDSGGGCGGGGCGGGGGGGGCGGGGCGGGGG